MIDSLLVAAALFASQGGYGMPAPPSIPRTERLPESTEPAAPAPQPIVPAVPGKTLRDLPNITYTYIDVSGRDFKAINKSLERQQKPGPDGRPAIAPTTWSVDAKFNRITNSGQCKVASAKAEFSANVVLPRLVSDPAHSPQFLATWRAYLAGIENERAATLWFVYDRLGQVENAILASSCENIQNVAAAAVAKLKAQAAEFASANNRKAQAAK